MDNCDGVSKPKFTPEQIAKCQGNKAKSIPACRNASGKGFWCCRFGCWIVQPKVIRPFPRNNTEFNKDRFKRNYAIAVEMAKNSGKKLISENIFVKRRQSCAVCPQEDKQGCSCVGCKWWRKLVYVDEDDKGEKIECSKHKW